MATGAASFSGVRSEFLQHVLERLTCRRLDRLRPDAQQWDKPRQRVGHANVVLMPAAALKLRDRVDQQSLRRRQCSLATKLARERGVRFAISSAVEPSARIARLTFPEFGGVGLLCGL
jgi:hypothetical protein